MTVSGPALVTFDHAERIHAHDAEGRPLGLAETTLEIQPTRWTALIGSNGSGKSTLAALAAGLDRPTAGRIGRPDARRTAVATQDTSLDPLLTVAENLALAARLSGRGQRASRHIAANEAQALGLTDRLSTRVAKLSGGLARRAHAARAFATGRELIVLDEPDTGLDAAGLALLAARCRAAAQNGSAVITVTHEPDLASAADRVIALADARVVADAPPADLLGMLGPIALRCAHPLDLPAGTPPGAHAVTDAAGTLFVTDDDNAVRTLAADAARAGRAVTIGPSTLADAARLLARTRERTP